MFWYNYWFTDFKYHAPLYQDRALRTFFYVYVNYGLFFPSHPLMGKYWYRGKDIKIDYDSAYNTKCFRFHNTPYDENDTFGKYTTRAKLSCIYLSRMWILRFADWFILCFYALRPKETNLVRKIKISEGSQESNSISVSHSKKTRLGKRLKFLLTYYFVRRHLTKTVYLF